MEVLISNRQAYCLAHGFREAVYALMGDNSAGEEAWFLVKDSLYDRASSDQKAFVIDKKTLASLGSSAASVTWLKTFDLWRFVARSYVTSSKERRVPLSRGILLLLDEAHFETLGWEE